MMMRVMVSTVNLSVLGFIFACTTVSKSPATIKMNRSSATPSHSESANQSLGQSKPSPLAAQIPQNIAMDVEYAAFFSRLVVPENEYTERDRQILIKIPPSPSGGSIHEAALTIGLLRDVLTPIGVATGASGLDSADPAKNLRKNTLTPQGTPSAQSINSRSIELRSQAVGLDLIGAMSSNPYLQGRFVHKMAFESLLLGGNSPIFSGNLKSALQREGANWRQFAEQLDGKENAFAQEKSLTPGKDGNTPTDSPNVLTLTNPSPAVQTNELALEKSQDAVSLLAKAQEFAAKDQIDRAIVAAKMVPENSDTYQIAQQNIKLWSDRATQDLRKQAAQQYRVGSATPDAAGKKVYLSKARSLLEEAINKYPESSNLETIKDNLEIIDQELNRLE